MLVICRLLTSHLLNLHQRQQNTVSCGGSIDSGVSLLKQAIMYWSRRWQIWFQKHYHYALWCQLDQPTQDNMMNPAWTQCRLCQKWQDLTVVRHLYNFDTSWWGYRARVYKNSCVSWEFWNLCCADSSNKNAPSKGCWRDAFLLRWTWTQMVKHSRFKHSWLA